MKAWKDRFWKLSFDKKMQLIFMVAIIVTTGLMTAISMVSSISSLKQRSVELLEAQNKTVAENFRSSLDNYKSLAVATVLDSSVQQYTRIMTEEGANLTSAKKNAYSILESINNMYSDLNFIALIDQNMTTYMFKGKSAMYDSAFPQTYALDAQKCKIVSDSTIKMCFNNAYFHGSKYTLSIYFPIYDTFQIFGELGLLCMNFTDPTLTQIMKYDTEANMNLAMIDAEGGYVSSNKEELIGTQVDYMDQISGNAGTFTKNGKMYLFQKVDNWKFYVVSSVPMLELFRSSFRMVVIMLVILLLSLIICTRIISTIIRKAYRPLDKVVKKMDDVATGSLKTRISVENMGEDFTKLAIGFNSMMEEIQILMEQVKLEQHQMEQIRFNALQSQIQPHFLYNTLECIHWQAVADGNQEISRLVKALAKYYRICLSNGHDVIPLEMELEHVRNYLIIQNMRYDNIIGSVFDIEDTVTNTMIPKLTLQPLVENSIYHGIKAKEDKTGTLFITAKREGADVLITVSDTGMGMTQEKIDEMNLQVAEHDDSFGYGVRNVNKRIELLYGTQYGLHFLKNRTGGGLTVEIRLPYIVETKETMAEGGTDV
ncbi:MAG: sensor histidine kinase [Muricoprocola sp.]